MNKELEALERLKNTLLAEGYWQDVLQDVVIIEKALKRNVELEEENKLLRENNENLDENYFEAWFACEELKKSSNYALMFVDDIYCLVDTKDNKFEVIDNHEINSKGIIENKKLKALEIIKEYFKINYPVGEDNDTVAIGCLAQIKDMPKEKFKLLKEILL